MYANYINFLIRNDEQDVDLKKLYDTLFHRKTFPVRLNNNIKIDTVEVCSDNRGCHPKSKGVILNKTTVKKNASGTYGTQTNNKRKYVVMFVKGTINLSEKPHNINLRIPKTGRIKVSMGFGEQQIVDLQSASANRDIEALIKEIGTDISQYFQSEITFTNVNKIELLAMSVQAGNINQDGVKREILNFKETMMMMGNYVSKKGYALNYGVQNTKSLTKGYFKPTLEDDPEIRKQMPTFGITNMGSIDFVGVVDLRFVSKMHSYVKKVWNRILRQNIKFSNRKVINKRLPKAPVQRNARPISNKILYNFDKEHFIFRGKKFNCSMLKKNDIMAIASSLSINPIGTRGSLCKAIETQLPKKKTNFIALRNSLKKIQAKKYPMLR